MWQVGGEHVAELGWIDDQLGRGVTVLPGGKLTFEDRSGENAVGGPADDPGEGLALVGREGGDVDTIERVIGTSGSILEYADALADAGVDELTIGVGGGPDGYDLGELGELLQWRDHRNAAS